MSETSATPVGPLVAPSSPQATAAASPSATVASPVPSQSQRSDQRKGTTIITADIQFGSMLDDASGQAIYLSMLSAAPDRSATTSVRTPGHRC